MCKKLFYFVSLVLVLSIAGNASADLLVHWALEEGAGTTAFDTSGNGNDGTFSGEPQWVDGHGGGSALQFDGVDDFVVYSFDEEQTLTACSIAFWVKADTVGQAQYRSPFTNYYPNSSGFQIDTNGGDPGEYRINPSGLLFGTVTTDWIHLAVTCEGTSASLYYNGALATTGTLQNLNFNQFAIGVNRNRDNWFSGIIDDFRVYDHVLSEVELLSAMEGKIFPYAFGPEPEDGAIYTDTWANLAWKPGGFAVSHDVYIGDNFEDVNSGTESAFLGNQAGTEFIVGFPGMPYPDGLVPGTTYYWRIDEVNDAEPNSPWKGDVWSFWIQPQKAYNPSPTDGVKYVLTDVTLDWEAGMAASLHYAHFGENFDDVNNAEGGQLLTDATHSPGTLESGKTYYWRIDEFADGVTHKGDVWSFTTVSDVQVTNPNLTLWWSLDEAEGRTAVDMSGHGNHGIINGNAQWVDGFQGTALTFGADDYVEATGYPGITGTAARTLCAWIKTADNNRTIMSWGLNTVGNKWRMRSDATGGLRVEVNGGYNYGATNIADGQWHHVAITFEDDGTPDVVDTLLYLDGQPETSAASQETAIDTDTTGVVRIGKSPYHTSGFIGVMDDARIYDKVLTLEEIQQVMLGNSKLAGSPVPVRDAIVDIRDISSLSWSAGDTASSHDVYLGTDRDAVAAATKDSPEFQGNQAGTSLSSAGLVELGGGDYFWRIDEIEADGTMHTGMIWKFTVPDYLVVDDFESYNDINEGEPGSNRIYLAWVDGFDNPAINGSVVGNFDAPFAEQTIVHSGNQSMPLAYDNAVGKSEATLTLTSGRDWTSEGVNTLVIWYIGDAANAPETMYVVLNGTAGVDNDNPDAALADEWTEWRIDLTRFADQGINLTNVNTITLGFGSRTNPVAGGSGMMYFDDIRLYPLEPETP